MVRYVFGRGEGAYPPLRASDPHAHSPHLHTGEKSKPQPVYMDGMEMPPSWRYCSSDPYDLDPLDPRTMPGNDR